MPDEKFVCSNPKTNDEKYKCFLTKGLRGTHSFTNVLMPTSPRAPGNYSSSNGKPLALRVILICIFGNYKVIDFQDLNFGGYIINIRQKKTVFKS